jgi:hypothetical protein
MGRILIYFEFKLFNGSFASRLNLNHAWKNYIKTFNNYIITMSYNMFIINPLNLIKVMHFI